MKKWAFILSRMLLVASICILIAAGIALFYLPFGGYFQMFGIVMFGEGLLLLIFGGSIGAGLWYKVYSAAFMRSQKRAIRQEMKTFHKERREYTVYGYYFAAVGVILLFVGLAFTMI
ncbi:MAG: hypothetical protein Q6361_05975 [Candidatus Hermodarchaeota archaeon]|jgi:hypothetical protein|nr:hypothetical protein [Candidatus Hermodarchaeota archaeon]